MSNFFIRRPIVAIVISILTVMLGVIVLRSLSVEQYPFLAPPNIRVTGTYPGASAEAVEQSVATPIEQEINGVDNMIYMKSSNTSDGRMLLDVNFQVGMDQDTANVLTLLNVDLEAGRFFTPLEDEHAAAVAIIGHDIKDQIFPNLDPIGRTVYVHGYPLRVIGLQSKLGNVLGQNRDNVIFVPLSFQQKVMTSDDGIAIMVRPVGGMKGLEETEGEVRTLLRSLRRTPFAAEDPFGVVGAEAIQSLWRSISAAAFAVMMLISGLSLVVGGIVVANIMFVSVVERTPEIGLRMALGAKKRDIKRQFLMESSLLATLGGAGGVVAGALVALAVNQIFPAQVKLGFILIGLVTAAVTGLVAGLAPAAAAAKLAPVEALRYE